MPYIAYLFHLLIIPTRATGNPELEAALLYQQIYLETVLEKMPAGAADSSERCHRVHGYLGWLLMGEGFEGFPARQRRDAGASSGLGAWVEIPHRLIPRVSGRFVLHDTGQAKS